MVIAMDGDDAGMMIRLFVHRNAKEDTGRIQILGYNPSLILIVSIIGSRYNTNLQLDQI